MKIFTTLVTLLLLTNLAFADDAVTVDITLSPMGNFKAKTNELTGFAEFKGKDKKEISASNVQVNLKSLKTGVELRDKHTIKHLDAEKFPQAVLVSATGKDGKGTGKIKIKGIEKDISGTYVIDGKMLKAEFNLNLADFDIKDINYMGVGVEDEVKLHINIPIKN